MFTKWLIFRNGALKILASESTKFFDQPESGINKLSPPFFNRTSRQKTPLELVKSTH